MIWQWFSSSWTVIFLMQYSQVIENLTLGIYVWFFFQNYRTSKGGWIRAKRGRKWKRTRGVWYVVMVGWSFIIFVLDGQSCQFCDNCCWICQNKSKSRKVCQIYLYCSYDNFWYEFYSQMKFMDSFPKI